MKPTLIVLAVAITHPAAAAMAPAIDYDRLADAIAAKETGQSWPTHAIGAHGELSRYQITLAVWRQHSGEPFAVAMVNEAKARAVAMAHLRWLASVARSRALPPTPATLATAYNRGHTWLGRVNEYGVAVENLYLDPTFCLQVIPVGPNNTP